MQHGVRSLLRLSPTFTALLPANDRQENFRLVAPAMNPSRILFARGTPENLARLVTKCRAEGTTFFGAFSAAVFLGSIVATESLHSDAFKLTFATNFGMRNRVATPIDRDAVGCFVTAGEMPTPTLNVPQQTFWDLARTLKQLSVENVASFPAIALPLIMMDQHFQRDGDATLPQQFPLKGAMLADADVSSLGMYPYARTHTFASGELAIETLHYAGNVPFLGAGCYFYATSLDHVGYGMSHRVHDATGQALFDTVVAIMEASGHVESHETLGDVVAKLQLVGKMLPKATDSPTAAIA